MEWLQTTPLEATALRPMTLPANCYGEPGSRRWDVEMEPPRGGNNLGENMEAYIKLYPDPRTARGYYQSLPGAIFPLEDLTDVVVRELIKYLPPMSVIHLANMLENFRREVINNKKAFETRICPCHTEIIGNQCWRHTKSQTNLFRRLKPILLLQAEEECRPIAIEQVEELRRRIDQNNTRRDETRHYGGTEGWNRRYAKPSGLHEAMLVGNPHALAEMFPPGTIEEGIIHATIHATRDHPRKRTMINTLGLLLLRIAGAAITVHSIRMKGRLDQTQSDAMSEMIRRQGGAACQLCIEGEQQIRNPDRYNAPRWNTISSKDRGPESRLPPIPHLLNNFFVRASLLGIEEQTAKWGTTMTGAREVGEYSPDLWRVVEPYLSSTQTGEAQRPSKKPRFLISYPESPSLGMYDRGPYIEVKPRCSPIPPISHQLTGRRQPERNWRYMDYYDPSGTQSRLYQDTDQLRAVRARRLGDIEIWELDRQAAEWARHNETATPTLDGGFAPIYTDRRDLISEDEDSDTGKEAETEDTEPGEQYKTSPGEEPCSSPHSGAHAAPKDRGSDGYIRFLMPEVAETPEHWQTMIRALYSESEEYTDTESESGYSDQDMKYESGGSSETEPGSPARPEDMKYESEGSSETEPGPPAWSGDQTEDKGEPSKVKTEEPVPSKAVKAEEVDITGIRDGTCPDPQPDTWSEPESPDMWDYYLSSDGETRNYYFIEYGPRPGETKWPQKP